jgi:solute carrier family 35 protein F3/4
MESSLLEGEARSAKPRSAKWWPVFLIMINQAGNIGSSELMQMQETRGPKPFDSPYWSIWFNHCVTGFTCALIVGTQLAMQRGSSLQRLLHDAGYSRIRTFAWDAVVLAVWCQLFNICWAVAVSKTTVAVFMAINMSACVPIFALSVIFLGESVTAPKIACVACCLGGVVLVSVRTAQLKPTGEDASGLFWSFGYLALFSIYMLVWGAKVTARVKPGVPDRTTLPMIVLLGFATLCLLWWPLLVLDKLGVEPLVFPTAEQWRVVGAVAALAIFSNLTFMLALSASTPLFVTIGQVLQIPGAAAADLVLHGVALDPWSCAGYVLISCGFVAFSLQGAAAGATAAEEQAPINEDAGAPSLRSRPSSVVSPTKANC